MKLKKSKAKTPYLQEGSLKDRSIRAGIYLLTEGNSNFSLRDIAKLLDISHGAPGKHFGNKEGLLASIAEEGFRNFSVVLEDNFIAENPRETFYAMGKAYVNFALEHPQHYSLMFGRQIANHKDYPDLLREGGRAFSNLVQMIQWLQKEGVIKNGPTLPLAFTILSSLHGFVNLNINGVLENSADHLPMEKLGPFKEALPKLTENLLESLLCGMQST